MSFSMSFLVMPARARVCASSCCRWHHRLRAIRQDCHVPREPEALGMEVAVPVYQQMPVLHDSSPEILYVRQLGQKLVATIPSQYSWPFEFHVVPQTEINAFALPGGQMFMNIETIHGP